MKRIVRPSGLFKEDEDEIIFLPESLCEEIDVAIKQTKSYTDRNEFVSSAVSKFISTVSEDKIKFDKRTG